jgi:hypothetical protein
MKKLLIIISFFLGTAASAGIDDYLPLCQFDNENERKLRILIRHGFQCELIQKRSLDVKVACKPTKDLRQTSEDNCLTTEQECDISENRADFKAKKSHILVDLFLNECSRETLSACVVAIGKFLEKENTFSVELDMTARRLQHHLTSRQLKIPDECYKYENEEGLKLRQFVHYIALCESKQKGILDNLQKKEVVTSPKLKRLDLVASADRNILPKGGSTRSDLKKSDAFHYDAEQYLESKSILEHQNLLNCYIGTVIECSLQLSKLLETPPFSAEIHSVLQTLIDAAPKIKSLDAEYISMYLTIFMNETIYMNLNFDSWGQFLHENRIVVPEDSSLYYTYSTYKLLKDYEERLKPAPVSSPQLSRDSLKVQPNSRSSGTTSPKTEKLSPRSPRALLKKLSDGNLFGKDKDKTKK